MGDIGSRVVGNKTIGLNVVEKALYRVDFENGLGGVVLLTKSSLKESISALVYL